MSCAASEVIVDVERVTTTHMLIDRQEVSMSSTSETGHVTGTKDKDYNLIWFTEQSLSNALRLEDYIQDAERLGDTELTEFFRRAQEASRKGGEQGKKLLGKRLPA
jgi:hypothetical protein